MKLGSGSSRPQVSDSRSLPRKEAHTLGEGLGSKPFCSGLRVALSQMPLDVHRAQLLRRNNATETEMERDVLRLGLLVGIQCILVLAFRN